MYNYDNFSKVRDMIDERRENARREADVRSAKMRMLSPEIEKIDEELHGTGLLIFKTAISGGDIDAIKKRNLELNKRRREIIKSLGYPEDYTDVKYSCTICSDTGFLENTKMCSCFKKLFVTENIKASGMGKLIEEQSFENFNMKAYETDPEAAEAMDYAIRVAKAFADGFGKKYKGKNLLFIGKTGTGKTHISTSIAKRVIELGYDVLYESVQNIISSFENDKFRSGYGPYEPIADKYLECDLLIIDDLGTEFSTPFAVSCLYNLITTRKNKGYSTIISTNLTADELAKRYDDRIYSRIVGSDYTTVNFAGDDYRLYGSAR